jgi:histone-lysine N-methyltransferase SETMAR
MSNFVPTKQHLREVLLHYFVLKKNATEAHRLLMEAYGEYSPTDRTCRTWFERFRNGDFDVDDKERPGHPKKFEDEQLEALLEEDVCQTQEELAKSLGVTQQAISLRLKAAGFIQKQGNWVPHELKPRDVERRFCMSEILLQRQKKKGFLHRIVTGDEKWIYYDNPNQDHRHQSKIFTVSR